MSLDINLEYFVDGSMGYNLKSTEEYKKNIDLCSKASEKISKEIKEQSNEIFNSFTLDYQNSSSIIAKITNSLFPSFSSILSIIRSDSILILFLIKSNSK